MRKQLKDYKQLVQQQGETIINLKQQIQLKDKQLKELYIKIHKASKTEKNIQDCVCFKEAEKLLEAIIINGY